MEISRSTFNMTSPGAERESNWLPAPDEPFYLCLRLYNAKSDALNFDWVPPAVQQVEGE